MRDTIFLCSFLGGVDELPRKLQSDAVAVLTVLKATGKFSVFEATANETIARMMTKLCRQEYSTVRGRVRTDYGRLIETDISCGYPWTTVTLTPGGERLLSESETRSKQQREHENG